MVSKLRPHVPFVQPKKKNYLSETLEKPTKFLMTSREAKRKKREKKKSPVVYFSGNKKGIRSSKLDPRKFTKFIPQKISSKTSMCK